MILFFGTRPGKSKTKELYSVKCPHCGQKGTLTVTEVANWFHLFWIKIFKISKNILAECSHCKRVYYKDEFTEEMRHAMHSN